MSVDMVISQIVKLKNRADMLKPQEIMKALKRIELKNNSTFGAIYYASMKYCYVYHESTLESLVMSARENMMNNQFSQWNNYDRQFINKDNDVYFYYSRNGKISKLTKSDTFAVLNDSIKMLKEKKFETVFN